MKILLKNFGAYTDETFEFANNSFTLFKGENGSGKSTIFKAICWVLYNKYKSVKHGEDACQVVLTDQNWIVKRISKPQTLKVRFDSLDVEGSVAQSVILDKIMKMNWEQFCISTMISSNARCSLASITPTERFNVIRELVSTLDEPRVHAEKIAAFEKTLKSGSDNAQGRIDILSEQLDKLKTVRVQKVEFDKQQYDDLEKQLRECRKKKDEWLEILATGIARDEAKEKLGQLNMVEEVEKKLCMLKKCLIHTRHLDSIAKMKEDFEQGKKAHFKSLKKELALLTSEMENINEDQLKEVHKECEIRKSERDDENECWDWTPEKIAEELKNSHIHDLKSTKQPCPYCNKTVAIDDNKIVAWDKSWNKLVGYNLSKLANLKYEWDEMAAEKWSKAVITRNRIKTLKDSIENGNLSPELIRMKRSFGETISPPKGYKTTYTVEYLEERIETLSRELGSFPKEDSREILEIIVASKKYPTREKINALEKEITSVELKLSEMNELRGEYDKYLEYQKTRQHIQDIETQLSEIKKKGDQDREDAIAVARLKAIQKEAEIMSMENVVATLNLYAAEYLQKFFDETITVVLSLIKKTAKDVKMSMEIDIQYVGTSFDINEFSQGELIKINLAFILAMNRLQGSNYLFLDEVLQNLDKGVLLEIYSCLKDLTTDVSIYVIDHNSIEGFFDNVIEFLKK